MNVLAMENEKEFLEYVIRFLPGHVYWKDKDGLFLGCNEAQAQTFKLKNPKDIIGTTDFDYYPKEYAAKVVENDKMVMSSRQLQTIEEIAVRPGVGKKIYLSKKIPLIDKKDNIIGVLGISFDITERKQAEEAVQYAKEDAEHENMLNSEFLAQLTHDVTGKKVDKKQPPIKSAEEMRAYLENIIALMPGHVYWQDRNNVFLGCNDLQAKSAGLKSRKDIVGKTNDDMFWKDQASDLNTLNNTVMATGQPHVAEEYAEMVNGPGYYLSHKVPLKDINGEIIGILGVSLDISARKEAEEYLVKAKKHAEEASRAKSQFIANMSHDIRTPLTGLLGMSETLAKRLNDTEEKELANHIVNSGKRLSRLLNEVLEFAALDIAKQEVELTIINIKNLLNDVIHLMTEESKQKNNQLLVNFGEDFPDFIVSNSMRIYRILLNLIGNALRFTKNGKISLEAYIGNQSNSELILVVKDTGIGVPPDKIESIFEPFFKINTSYSENSSGVGLGLHIVNQFAKDLSGKIAVESHLGKGSEFTLTIPLMLPSDDQISAITSKKPKPEPTMSSKTSLDILLVEDDEICQRVAEVMLTELKHRVDIAGSAEEVLMKLEKKYDLILMDIGLPDMDGMELAKKIRSEPGCNQKTYIAALTAHVSKQHKEQFLKAGMDAVLFKPFSVRELQEMLVLQAALES